MAGIEETLKGVEEKIGKQPWYVWAGALAGAGVVSWYVLKNRAAGATVSANGSTPATINQSIPDASTMQALNGFDVASMAGIPYGYSNTTGPIDNFPTSDSGTSTGIVSGTPTTPTSTTEYGLVRTRNNSGVTSSYDAKTPQGVPVHSTPGGSTTGYVAYGSEIQIAGAPISGPSNLPNSANGSSLWFPLTNGGYISAYDVANVFTGQNKGTGTGGYYPSEWQQDMNSTRNTVDQHAVNFSLLTE